MTIFIIDLPPRVIFPSQTTATNLDRLYKEYDEQFPFSREIDHVISDAINRMLQMPQIHGTALMKPHIFYGLVLGHAIKPIEKLKEKYRPTDKACHTDRVAANLSIVAEALEQPDEATDRFKDFVQASARTTNDAKRWTRIFQMLSDAVAKETSDAARPRAWRFFTTKDLVASA